MGEHMCDTISVSALTRDADNSYVSWGALGQITSRISLFLWMYISGTMMRNNTHSSIQKKVTGEEL